MGAEMKQNLKSGGFNDRIPLMANKENKKMVKRKAPQPAGGRFRVVTLGGGTGSFTVLFGLKEYNELDITAIVSMADDGGSTGILRDQYGVLPPGDARRALVALAREDGVFRELFSYKFSEGALSGHSIGNLLLAGLEKLTGSFKGALLETSRLLAVSGKVVPVTEDNVRLHAVLEDGELLFGEHVIDVPHGPRSPIRDIWLEPEAKISKDAKIAIANADVVVICPGDLYTSIVPNILVKGVREALSNTKGKVIFVTNIATKNGETNSYTASDFLRVVESFLEDGTIDVVIMNTERPSESILRKYKKEGAELVMPNISKRLGLNIIKGKFVANGGLLRHDHQKLSRAIWQLTTRS